MRCNPMWNRVFNSSYTMAVLPITFLLLKNDTPSYFSIVPQRTLNLLYKQRQITKANPNTVQNWEKVQGTRNQIPEVKHKLAVAWQWYTCFILGEINNQEIWCMWNDFLSDYDLEYPSHVTIHNIIDYWYITFLGRKNPTDPLGQCWIVI